MNLANPVNPEQVPTLRFHHVGIVTGQLDESIAFYADLGYEPSEAYTDPLQHITVVLMRRAGDPLIELIAPDGSDSTAASWIGRIMAGPYHTCYEVENIDRAIGWLAHRRFAKTFGPVPATAFSMRRVAFLWGAQSGLVELLETAGP